MKYTIRKKWMGFLLYGFITRLQKCEGITSIVPNEELHYVLMDLDETNYFEVLTNLQQTAPKHNLKNVVIMSDKEGSYRIFSPTKVEFKELIQILFNMRGIDYNFIKWTVRREYATIRISKKKGRNNMKILNILYHDGIYKPSIDMFKLIEYQTDI